MINQAIGCLAATEPKHLDVGAHRRKTAEYAFAIPPYEAPRNFSVGKCEDGAVLAPPLE